MILKLLLIKFVLFVIPHFRNKPSFAWLKLYHIFSLELSCFSPFFVISSASALLDISQSCLYGKINSIIQILVLISLSHIPMISFVFSAIKKGEKIKKNKKYAKKNLRCSKASQIKIKRLHCQTVEKYINSLIYFFIPLMIVLDSKLVFFLMTTPLIVGRLVFITKNAKIF